jgi:hypothetical protein
MNEIVFLIVAAPDGGYCARALRKSIFTEADKWNDLCRNIRGAVKCHFDDGKKPGIIRLHSAKRKGWL